MKLFKDVKVGENFVLHNGQQLIRISPLTSQTHNCLDYPFYQNRFSIEDDTECLTVMELMEMSDIVQDDVEPTLTEAQHAASKVIVNGFKGAFDKFDWAAVAAEDTRQKMAEVERGEWIVDTKISKDRRSVEVSAVIKGSHGHSSWGWHDDGETKYSVLSTNALYQQTPVMGSIIQLAEDEARRICRTKNK